MSLSRSRLLGLSSIGLSLFCWINAFSKWSLFDAFSSVAERRGAVIVCATASFALALLAGIRGARGWLIACVPAAALLGLLRLH